jgi:hypothetical protein
VKNSGNDSKINQVKKLRRHNAKKVPKESRAFTLAFQALAGV